MADEERERNTEEYRKQDRSDNDMLREAMQYAAANEGANRRNVTLPSPMPPDQPYGGMLGLGHKAHPLLFPLAEIAQIIDQLRPLFMCGYGITRTEREAPAYPKLIRAALLEVQDRIPKALKELDKMESKKGEDNV